MATDCFAVYRLPKRKDCTFVQGASTSISLHETGEASGFVIAPFAVDDKSPIVVIKAEKVLSFASAEEIPNPIQKTINNCFLISDEAVVSRREDYSKDFQHFHSRLESGEFSKIVLARRSVAETTRAPFEMFREACERYPRMFITLFSTPESGTWLMATPEVLVEKQGERWHTMALAGTMKLDGKALLFDEPIGNRQTIMWEEKNIQEQRFVATYINEQLRPLASEIVEDGPRTVRAGNLVHLRSDFFFTTQENIGTIIETLHPTPAVCGLPKEKARDLIIVCEHSPRSYYSGFAGPVGVAGETHLYVSLRCMRIRNGECDLFAGGGLLRDSEEQSEWEETEAKMMTMKALLTN